MNAFDDRAVPFVLGMLAHDDGAAVEQVLADDDALRDDVAAVEQLLRELSVADSDAPALTVVRDRLVHAVADASPWRVLAQRLGRLFDLDEAQAATLLRDAQDLSGQRWQRAGIAGARLLHLAGGPAVAQADCGLIHLAPGVTFPRHEHLGDEWALVLQGSIAEVDGVCFEVGDIAFSPAGSAHALRVVGDSPVLLAVVNYVGIRL